MDVITAVKTRISTRAFLPDPVPMADIQDILDIARYSPSSSNLQPWGAIVVTGEAKQAVSDLAIKAFKAQAPSEEGDYPIYPKDLPQKYQDRRAGVGKGMYELMGIERDDMAARMNWVIDNYNFYGAPAGIFFTIDRLLGRNQWASLGMFMQTVCLVAQAKGYATCMQEIWAQVRDSVHAQLSLDENIVIYSGMALGKADPDAPVNTLRTEREPVDGFSKFVGF